MISVKYNFNDYITELLRDKIPTNVRQDVARELYNSGQSYSDLTENIKNSYKPISSGNIAKYKLV
jgi:hypothetical protein